MFAFAVWDTRQQTLLLARDRMGEKPLYYYAGPDAFVFGSELRALLPYPAVPRRLDLASLDRYLASGSPGTRLKINVAIPRLLKSKLFRPVNSDSLSFYLGISEFTVIPTPPLVKVTSPTQPIS